MAAWTAFHLWFLAQGEELLIHESNSFLAKTEFAFTIIVIILALFAWFYLVFKTRKGYCALCNRQLKEKK